MTVDDSKSEYTRVISPRLGILGLLGFLGFIGFIPGVFNYRGSANVPFVFFFFAFFGFFGFYYEGKMSNTQMDERFLANRQRAAARASQTALTVIVFAAIISLSVLRLSVYMQLSFLIAVIGFAFGLSCFLQQYLLYRYENEE